MQLLVQFIHQQVRCIVNIKKLSVFSVQKIGWVKKDGEEENVGELRQIIAGGRDLLDIFYTRISYLSNNRH